MSDAKFSTQVTTFAQAPSMEILPEVIDIRFVVPLNPPEAIQMKFVGLSYESAYAEAETFVRVADEFAAKHGRGGFASLDRIVDFRVRLGPDHPDPAHEGASNEGPRPRCR